MVKVRKLTPEQAEILQGQVWGYNGQVFNVYTDADGNLYIGETEVNGCTLAQAQAIGCDAWLLSLPEIDYNPIINELP